MVYENRNICLAQKPALTLPEQERELEDMELQLEVIESRLKSDFPVSLKSLGDYFPQIHVESKY